MANARNVIRKAGLYGVPILAVGLGLYFYATGGRYVGTDNAFLKSPAVAVSSDISGRVMTVEVAENERVQKGDLLYTLDKRPIEIALAADKADYQSAVNAVLAKQSAYRQRQIDLDAQRLKRELAEREYARRLKLVGDRVISVSEFDQHKNDADVARRDEAAIAEDLKRLSAELGGDPAASPETNPAVMAAAAKIAEDELDLSRTDVRAPAAGIISKIDSFRPGDWSVAGTAAFQVYSSEDFWVEANLKETDLTHVKTGQPATIRMDAYPGMKLKGHVTSIGAATGAEFSVIPPENATGNWVKVVQRVPVRIVFDGAVPDYAIRSGLSVIVDIDTGRARGLGSLIPLAQAAE